MKYEYAPDIQRIAEEISLMLFPHIKLNKIKCFRSYGSKTRGTIARCHALGKIMQKTIGVDAYYALEFLHERFDKLSEGEQLKTIIHELMHIPKNFGGGFKHHDYVCDKNINKFYKEYKIKKKERENNNSDIVNFRNSNADKSNLMRFNNPKDKIFWKNGKFQF